MLLFDIFDSGSALVFLGSSCIHLQQADLCIDLCHRACVTNLRFFFHI